MNIYIETYGCSANQNNSEIISGILEKENIIVKNPKIADIAILNTCIVKGPTLQRMKFRIQKLSKEFQKLIVTGCMPDVMPYEIKKIANKNCFVSLVGSHNIKEISKVVKALEKNKPINFIKKRNEIKLCFPKKRQNSIIGITQIAEGCLGNCSYCIVKKAKRNLFSYPQNLILKNIEQDLRTGCKEIWLTSQDNSAYGLDKNSNLAELLRKIIKLNHKFFLRIGMMNPSTLLLILDELIEIYKDKKIFKFLHLPVQSGSNKILKLMKRNYKVKDFIKIIRTFRKEIPELTLSTDIIVGFPSETESDFKKTLDLIKEIKPDVLNISKFWPMPGTEAEKMEKIPIKLIKKRTSKLMQFHEKISLEKNKKLINKKFKILVDKKGFENTWLGRNENYKLIVIKSKEKILGKFLNVKVKKVTGHYLICKFQEKRDQRI